MLKKLSFRSTLLFIITGLLIFFELRAHYPSTVTPTEKLDFAARDVAMRLRGIQEPDERIVIVAIDDFSFNWTKYAWPWPRSYFADIVRVLNEDGAKVIGLDVMLFESDPNGDPLLAAAFAKTPVSVSVMQKYTDHQGIPGILLPQPIYRDVFDGLGTTQILLDDDAIARSFRVHDRHEEADYFNWAFEIVRLYEGAPPITEFSNNSITLGTEKIPLHNNNFLINFHGPAGTYPIYSAAQVALGDYPPESFKDKIVLIGATSVTLQDIYPTPFSSRERTSGVEIVANAIDALLHRNYLQVAPPWVSVLLILLAALFTPLILRSPRPSIRVILMVLSMLAYGVIYYFTFSAKGIYLPFVSPEIMLFLGVTMPTLEQAVSQEIEKRRVRNLFSRFISPKMVDQLIATQDINSLNKRSEITILFSDIRGFTTLSEKLTPDGVVTLLNPYLDAMTRVVHKHGGTVDKYEGDAVLAFFGEPVPYEDHALRAARAALDMRLALAELIDDWEKSGVLPKNFVFDIGIGLNSGDVFVGLLGSEERINYTIIGDNVNLAARLQDLTKIYGWSIIISESTQKAIDKEFETEFIEAVRVKGKSETVKIYKLLKKKQPRPTEN